MLHTSLQQLKVIRKTDFENSLPAPVTLLRTLIVTYKAPSVKLTRHLTRETGVQMHHVLIKANLHDV